MDHATRQHGVKKRAGTCHMLPKQRGDLSCAPHLRRMKCVPMPRGAASEVACGRLSEVSILWTGVIRTAEASVAFGASYVIVRRN